jgi:glucose dehydrogenase
MSIAAFVPSLAAGLKRDTKFSGNITGNVYGQPLYVEDGPDGKAMVIVATESNNVYALDALTGGAIWTYERRPPCGVLGGAPMRQCCASGDFRDPGR